MKLLLIITLSVLFVIIILYIYTRVMHGIRTNRLQKNPKVGDLVYYYQCESKERGRITHVFKTHVRVRDIFNKYENVNFNNLYV